MMTKEGFTQIVNFTIPGAGVLMLGPGHISHIVKPCMYIQLMIAIVLRDYDAAFLYHMAWMICIYSMMELLIYKHEPF